MICRFSRAVVITLLLFATGRGSVAQPGTKDWIGLGRDRLEGADQLGAIEAADQALKLDRDNVRAIELRGELMRSQYGVVAALPWFERGLQIAPDDVALLEEYGATLGDAGRYRDMLAVARRILSLDSRNAKAFYMQAVLAARAGEYALAKRILSRMGDLANEMPAAMLLDAVCEYELGNYNRAVEQLHRLLARQPHNRTVRILLAQALYRAGSPLDSLDVIEQLASAPDADSYSLTLAARAFEASDQSDPAAPLLDTAAHPGIRDAGVLPETVSLPAAQDEARRNPGSARAVIPYIRLLLASGDSDTALAEAARLQAGNEGVAEAHMLVGDVEMVRGNLSSAIAAYRKTRAIAFTEPVMLRLVDALSRNSDERGAGEALSAFLFYNPLSLAGLRLAGHRSLDAGQWRSAIRLLERVRKRTGYNDSILLANLARAYSAAGDHQAAVREAAIAYRIAPASPMVTHVYGQVLLKARTRPKAAVELLEKAALMMPDNGQVARDLARARRLRS